MAEGSLTFHLSRSAVGPVADWPTFWGTARQLAGWPDGAPVFSYLEAVSACTLTRLTATEVVAAPPDSFEGRLFNAEAEVRWRRTEEGFVGTVVKEQSTGDEVTRSLQRYFLIGIETDEPGVFREGRYPGKDFAYPVDSGDGKDRRAFIEVVEYHRSRPLWPDDPEQIGDLLDAPLLVEHRFVGVGCGSD